MLLIEIASLDRRFCLLLILWIFLHSFRACNFGNYWIRSFWRPADVILLVSWLVVILLSYSFSRFGQFILPKNSALKSSILQPPNS